MVYINKAKYGECTWMVLEKAANKELFLRDPPPVFPEFNAWFSSKFPGVENKLVKALIYKTIHNSARDQETPLAFEYLYRLMNLAKASDMTVKTVIDQLSEALKVEYSSYSRMLSYARNIQIDKDLALSLQKEWNSFSIKKNDARYNEAISPITGESIHAPEYVKTITESKDCIKGHKETEYKKHDLAKVIKYLNARKVPQIIIDRLDTLLESADESDSIRYNRLLSCRNNLIGGIVWKINDQGYRVFPQGESLATLTREDRWAVMCQEDGFYEVDLTNAHFAILAFLINGQEMNKMLDNGSIWTQLLAYLGLDKGFKDSLKQCIYSMLYGSGADMQQLLLIQDSKLREELKTAKTNLGKKEKIAKTSEEKSVIMKAKHALAKRIDSESSEQDKEIYKKLIAHPAIAELLNGSAVLAQKIKNEGSFTDAFGHTHDVKEFRTIGKIMNTIMTSYEKKLLMPIYKEVFATRYFEIQIDQHDGLTLSFNKNIKGDPEVRAKIMQALKDKVNENAKILNIKTGLEIKGY